MQCSHQFVTTAPSGAHIEQQFGDDYFFGGGTSGYADYLSSEQLLRAHGKRYAETVAPFLTSRTALTHLDVGCAAGFVMSGFVQSGWTSIGIDPNQTMVEHVHQSGAKAIRGTLESADTIRRLKAHQDKFDLVTMIQVVAHLSDLDAALANLATLVRDNGYVLVETWDSQSRTARLLGSRWHEYSPPNVLHFFSGASLDRYMGKAGFELQDHGRPDKRITIGHGRSLFEYKYGETAWGKALLSASGFISDDLAVKYPSEDLFWRLYQKR
jgi:SAM-dependent methyltransferase